MDISGDPQNIREGQPVKIGRTIFHPIFLGQDVYPGFHLLHGLLSSHYYVEEIVAVVRSNKKMSIGQVISISGNIVIGLGSGVTKTIPDFEASKFLHKLVGSYYVADDVGVAPAALGGAGQPVRLGKNKFNPLMLGQTVNEKNISVVRDLLESVQYMVGEPVAVKRSNGQMTIGEVSTVNAEYFVVDVAGGLQPGQKKFRTSDVKFNVGKLLGSYYLAACDPTQVGAGAHISDLSRPVHNLQQIQKQIEAGKLRRHLCSKSDHIRQAFDKHKSTTPPPASFEFIPREKIPKALSELSVFIHPEALESYIDAMDLNRDGYLEFEEFERAVQSPSVTETWVQTLPLAAILADAMPMPPRSHLDPLRVIATLTPPEISLVVQGFSEAVKQAVAQRVHLLNQAITTHDGQHERRVNSKYDVVKMNCGKLEDFHMGLQRRIGFCNLDFWTGMETEHCSKAGFDELFTSSNFHIETTPQAEWQVVMSGRCPREHQEHGRVIPIIDELLNSALAKQSKLVKAEFHVYNTILRKHPAAEYERFKNNMFSTTIFVLVSAVQKISRVMKLPKGLRLYRGLGGTVELPEWFFQCDAHGCRGFSDWGFMSTTAKKDVAVRYSGLVEEKPVPIVLSIRVGAVDRGACIQDFSQYPGEEEYLYVPCSFLEPDGHLAVETIESGIVTVIPVKVNSNLKTHTVEDQQGKKKEMHISAFEHMIHEVERTLNKMTSDKEEALNKRLLNDSSRVDKKHTVAGFVERIIEQCKEVLAKHDAVSPAEGYLNDQSFRGLVWEMVDVKSMAIAKLEEWLENESSSFIHYRWNAPLRTVHRRWIAFLERKNESCPAADRYESALRLCKAKRLIVESVDEVNELKETRLMSAAAEGYSVKHLSILVDARADVNAQRPDGVTAIWLAAQFDNPNSIISLAEMKANFDQAANDGATPMFIAAQNGNTRCISVLKQLGADVNRADRNDMTPMHQAAMNGHYECLAELNKFGAKASVKDKQNHTPWDLAKRNGHAKCAELLEQLTAGEASSLNTNRVSIMGQRQLIISTGDISDVDGFYALAKYAQTGADVVFIMNYPAYVGESDTEVDAGNPMQVDAETTMIKVDYASNNPGLGFKYSARDMLTAKAKANELTPEFTSFLKRYRYQEPGVLDNDVMKGALTDVAFSLATKIWDETIATDSPSRGKLLFCIGGINSVNPFSAKSVKNEVLVYSKLLSSDCPRVQCSVEGAVFSQEGKACEIMWSDYSDIYMDFNGSIAFWNELWATKLSNADVAGKIRGVFVMGGVLAENSPITMPSIEGVLNRFSCATMNQLYHPQHTADFFAFLKQNKIDVFTVTNNVVSDLSTSEGEGAKAVKTDTGVLRFLSANGLSGEFLREVAITHYNSIYKPPRKAFDFYAALALTKRLGERSRSYTSGEDVSVEKVKWATDKTLFYSTVYGITIVSTLDTWDATLSLYVNTIDTVVKDDDTVFNKAKKEKFKEEIRIMNSIKFMGSIAVKDLDFQIDDSSGELTITVASVTTTTGFVDQSSREHSSA